MDNGPHPEYPPTEEDLAFSDTRFSQQLRGFIAKHRTLCFEIYDPRALTELFDLTDAGIDPGTRARAFSDWARQFIPDGVWWRCPLCREMACTPLKRQLTGVVMITNDPGINHSRAAFVDGICGPCGDGRNLEQLRDLYAGVIAGFVPDITLNILSVHETAGRA